jgi:drug/metabolite transporter (DMT)-like permease
VEKLKEKNTRMIFLMILCSIFWAGAFIAGKMAVMEIPPFTLTFLRFFFASILIFCAMVKFEKKDWRLKKEDLPVVFFLGIVGMVGYHILFFTALKYTSAINTSMIAATNPLMTSILASLFLEEKLNSKRIGAIAVALIGVILIITKGNLMILQNLTFNSGDIIMLLAVFCWAIYSIVSRRVMPKYSPLILTTYSFIICTIFTLPFAMMEKPLLYLPHVTLKSWAAVFYMAVFPSFIGYLVQQVSIRELGVSKTAIFINLVPFFSVILAAVILKEKITLLTVFSGALIILGVSLTTRFNVLKERKKIVVSHI